ncbi:MAG: glycerol acyltransferase [Bacteroidales bacterium]|nr:glycerol acyltransferase [Bacteroidales bacterium]
MSEAGPIELNVRKVLSERLGKRARFIPGFVKTGLEKLICQREMNALLAGNYPARGAEFCRGVLRDLDVSLRVEGAEHLPASPRCMIVSNHPLGGLDGISMIAWLSEHYGGRNVHFVVNDLLMAIEPLCECFVPVNKHGAQSRSAMTALDEALAGPDPVVIYPAGLVSRLGTDGRIADLEWRKMFVNKAIESGRPIVPVYFDGTNSRSFYKLANLRKKSGIKFNVEMILLPREVFRARGRVFTLRCGAPLMPEDLGAKTDSAATALKIRNIVYDLNTAR